MVGGVNIDKQEDMDQTIPVIRTIVHENYRDARIAVYNDIGLILFIDDPFFTSTLPIPYYYVLISFKASLNLNVTESSCFSPCTPSLTQL